LRFLGRALLGAVLGLPLAASALDFPVRKPSPATFRAHREKFLAKLPANSIAILHASPVRVMSNDVEYLYRPDSNFWYLTGIEDPEAIALLRPNPEDGRKFVVFLKPPDLRLESYEGPKARPADAVSAFGADAAFSVDEFGERLSRPEIFEGVEKVYLWDGGDAAWGETVRNRVAAVRKRAGGPLIVADARDVIHEMRVVKDPDEIELIRRATEISGRGHVLAMKAAAPGRYEFEVQAALDGYCYANGVRRMAYPSIVASGPDSVFLHWDRNDRQMQDGDVVLNDSGAEYGYYATDVTRTYPAGGKFSAEQRAIYDVVLAAQKAAMAQIRPGVAFDRPGAAATRVLTEGLVKLGLMSGSVEKIVKESGHRVFTKHGVSHWVGLDVHDVGSYNAGAASRPLEPGMAFTGEPGIYVAADPGVDRKWWNIGIRIEDVVLVTDTGSECLSCFVPREAVEVERMVQSGRPAEVPKP
jgi:Xaa-Pro aminopeptidase